MSLFQRLLQAFRDNEVTTGFVENPEADSDPRNIRYDEIAPLAGGGIPESGDVEKHVFTLNQGKSLSCTLHSMMSAVLNGRNKKISPRYGYHRIKADPKYPSSQLSYGAFMIDSFKLMTNEGICDYELCPNESTDSDAAYRAVTVSPPMEASARQNKGGGYLYVTTGAKTPEERFYDIIRYMHEQQDGVRVGLEWRSSFNNARKTGIVPPQTPTGSLSGHDMFCTSWKKINGVEYLGFRNSFGETWGDAGKIWLPKNYFRISTGIAALHPKLEVVIPKPIPPEEKNKHQERANMQELQAMVNLKFPLNVPEKDKLLNAKALSEFGTKKLVFMQAVTYFGWTFIDVINYLYARSRGKTREKAYWLDFTKTK